MKKTLKLRIVKFDRILAIEQIERTLLILATATSILGRTNNGYYTR